MGSVLHRPWMVYWIWQRRIIFFSMILDRWRWFVTSNTTTRLGARQFSTSTRLFKGRMPPKKVVSEKKVILGRPSNNLKVGIVGMPLLFFLFSSLIIRVPRTSQRRKVILLQRIVPDRCDSRLEG